MLDSTRNALLDRYRGISRLLAGQLDFNGIIRAVAEEIRHIIPHEHLDVCIKTLDGKYHIAYESGPETAWSKQPPALLTGSPIRSLLTGEVDFLLSADACVDPRFHFEGAFSDPILRLQLRSRLHVPLRVQGDIIGALSCSCRERDCYTSNDVENARAVADLLAPYVFSLRAAEQAKRSAIIEAEARAREEGLRLGAKTLTEALETERQRIGMDLHDQTLADLTRLARRMEKLAGLPTLPGEALEPLSKTLQHCMHDLRQIIEEAKPTVLQLFGLTEAIENHLERSLKESGQPIEWLVEDTTETLLQRLQPAVAVALFRIVQEAVNNAVRHAEATRIRVQIKEWQDVLAVEVADNGCGVPAGSHSDDALHRSYLSEAVRSALPECDGVIEADNGLSGEIQARSARSEHVVMDLQMSARNGIEAARTIWRERPETKILFWSNYSDEAYVRGVARIVPEGATYGYVLKSTSEDRLKLALRSVFIEAQCVIDREVRGIQQKSLSNNFGLSDVEYEILLDVAVGLTDKAIAQRKKLSLRSVQNRLQQLYDKLGVYDNLPKGSEGWFNLRTRAVAVALSRKVLNASAVERAERDLRQARLPEISS
eukprot:g29523.t1